MRPATVEGLTPDGLTLLVRLDDELGGHVVEVPLVEVRRAQRTAPTLPLGGGPSPREVQQRIRHGETAEDIARGCGLPVGDIARYEGPVLAERAHLAALARRLDVDGRAVEAVVGEHLARTVGAHVPVEWDSWQTDPNRWEVRARAGDRELRLALDPRAARIEPVDDDARVAFGHAPPPPDELEQVLRPVRRPARPAASPPPAARKGRAQVPLWDEIGAEVSGGHWPGVAGAPDG